MAPKLFNQSHPVTVSIYTALASMDVSCAWRFVQYYNEPATHASLEDHIAAANRFWREQLAAVPMVDTIAVRAHLIDRCDLQDWLRLFAQHVAPIIVSLDLPQELKPVLPDWALPLGTAAA